MVSMRTRSQTTASEDDPTSSHRHHETGSDVENDTIVVDTGPRDEEDSNHRRIIKGSTASHTKPVPVGANLDSIAFSDGDTELSDLPEHLIQQLHGHFQLTGSTSMASDSAWGPLRLHRGKHSAHSYEDRHAHWQVADNAAEMYAARFRYGTKFVFLVVKEKHSKRIEDGKAVFIVAARGRRKRRMQGVLHYGSQFRVWSPRTDTQAGQIQVIRWVVAENQGAQSPHECGDSQQDLYDQASQTDEDNEQHPNHTLPLTEASQNLSHLNAPDSSYPSFLDPALFNPTTADSEQSTFLDTRESARQPSAVNPRLSSLSSDLHIESSLDASQSIEEYMHARGEEMKDSDRQNELDNQMYRGYPAAPVAPLSLSTPSMPRLAPHGDPSSLSNSKGPQRISPACDVSMVSQSPLQAVFSNRGASQTYQTHNTYRSSVSTAIRSSSILNQTQIGPVFVFRPFLGGTVLRQKSLSICSSIDRLFAHAEAAGIAETKDMKLDLITKDGAATTVVRGDPEDFVRVAQESGALDEITVLPTMQ